MSEDLKEAYGHCDGKEVLVQFRGNVQLAMGDWQVERLAARLDASRAAPEEPGTGISPALVLAPKRGDDGQPVTKKNMVTGQEEPEYGLAPVPAVPSMVGTLRIRGPMLELWYVMDAEHPDEKSVKLIHPADVVSIDRMEVRVGE